MDVGFFVFFCPLYFVPLAPSGVPLFFLATYSGKLVACATLRINKQGIMPHDGGCAHTIAMVTGPDVAAEQSNAAPTGQTSARCGERRSLSRPWVAKVDEKWQTGTSATSQKLAIFGKSWCHHPNLHRCHLGLYLLSSDLPQAAVACHPSSGIATSQIAGHGGGAQRAARAQRSPPKV